MFCNSIVTTSGQICGHNRRKGLDFDVDLDLGVGHRGTPTRFAGKGLQILTLTPLFSDPINCPLNQHKERSPPSGQNPTGFSPKTTTRRVHLQVKFRPMGKMGQADAECALWVLRSVEVGESWNWTLVGWGTLVSEAGRGGAGVWIVSGNGLSSRDKHQGNGIRHQVHAPRRIDGDRFKGQS